MAAATFGVYVHIPFCASKCDYCAFATWTDRDHLVEAYLDALRTEIARAVDAGLPVADTVFVGGGTPTLVPADGLADVIASIPVSAGAEVTVECNPDDVTVELLRDLSARRCEPGQPRRAVDVGPRARVARSHPRPGQRRAGGRGDRARPGIPTFNLDLIYGAAGESVDDWRSTVAAALAFDPPHISAYGLTVEAGTPLAVAARPASRRRRPGRQVRARRRPADRRRPGQLRGVELGQARPRVPPQPPLLGPGRLPRLRLRGALARVGSPVVERAHTRSVHRADRPWRDGRGGVGDARRRDAPVRRPATGACVPVTG